MALSEQGLIEAREGGQVSSFELLPLALIFQKVLQEQGYSFDKAYTSVLKVCGPVLLSSPHVV